MSELHPSQLGGSGSLDESRRALCLPVHVSQCVDGFDGMQVCRDLGDDLLVLTEWGGLERATSLLGSSCSCWSNGQRVRGLEEPR